jgi:hypothetical protein
MNPIVLRVSGWTIAVISFGPVKLPFPPSEVLQQVDRIDGN